jgi:hypothetical protein
MRRLRVADAMPWPRRVRRRVTSEMDGSRTTDVEERSLVVVVRSKSCLHPRRRRLPSVWAACGTALKGPPMSQTTAALAVAEVSPSPSLLHLEGVTD